MAKTLLIVDGDAVRAAHLARRIAHRAAGFRLYLADSAGAAAAILARRPGIDLVLAADDLPDGRGADFLADLRQEPSTAGDLRTILCVAEPSEEPRQALRELARADAVIAQPADVDRVLAAAIASTLRSALVIDNEVVETRRTRARLERYFPGLEVRSAEALDTALVALREGQPRLILLDIHMPCCDGFAVLARLEADAGWARPRVIMLSSTDHEDDLRRVQETAAIEALLPKPLSIPALTDHLLGHRAEAVPV
ncbi:MAG: response regulator [Pseudomonadota bacterium]